MPSEGSINAACKVSLMSSIRDLFMDPAYRVIYARSCVRNADCHPNTRSVLLDPESIIRGENTNPVTGVEEEGSKADTCAAMLQACPCEDNPSSGLHTEVMYENKTRLICTAKGTPFQLFERIVTISDAQSTAPRTSSKSRIDYEICVDNQLAFVKDRTISRLTEMNSSEYLTQHAKMIADKDFRLKGRGNN